MTCSITFALFEFKVTYIVLSSEQAENIWDLDVSVSLPGDSSLMSVAASLPDTGPRVTYDGAAAGPGPWGWHLWWDKGHHSPLQLTLAHQCHHQAQNILAHSDWGRRHFRPHPGCLCVSCIEWQLLGDVRGGSVSASSPGVFCPRSWQYVANW